MTDSAKRVVEDLKARLTRIYGDRLIELRLFGSRARADSRPDSDYDVLVVLRGQVNAEVELFRCSHEVASVCLEHDAVVSCFFRSETALSSPDDPFLENALREGVTV